MKFACWLLYFFSQLNCIITNDMMGLSNMQMRLFERLRVMDVVDVEVLRNIGE